MDEKRNEDIWTPGRLLTNWGLRSVGGGFTNPAQPAEGGSTTSDDELQAVMYVQATEGFECARPVVRWVHAEFRHLRDFRIVLPGETIVEALNRLGWLAYLYHPTQLSDVRQLPHRAYDDFVDKLAERWKADPFIPIREPEELDANEIGEMAAADLADKVNRRWG